MSNIATQRAIIGTATAFVFLSVVGLALEYAFERVAPRSWWFTYDRIGIRYDIENHKVKLVSHLEVRRPVKFTFNDSLQCKINSSEKFETFSVVPPQTRWSLSLPGEAVAAPWVYRGELPRKRSECYVLAQPSIKTKVWGFDKYQTIKTETVEIEPFSFPPG